MDGGGSGSSWKGHQRARATAKSQRTAVDARSLHLHPYSRRSSPVCLVFVDLTASTLACASSALLLECASAKNEKWRAERL